MTHTRAGFLLAPPLVGVVAMLQPVVGLALCVFLVATERAEILPSALALAVGLVLRTQVVHWLARSTRCPIASLKRLAGRTSRTDWSRRLAARPLLEGWTSAVLRTRDLSAVVGAALAAVSGGSFVRFHASRFAGQLAWSGVGVWLGAFVLRALLEASSQGWGEIVAGVGALPLAWVTSRLTGLLCAQGWRHARIALERAAHHEYWPAWLFYAPLVPFVMLQGMRSRGVLTPSACNPAIEHAGGWIGESKIAIMRALGPSEFALGTVLVESGGDPAARSARARALMREHGLEFPIILKPDAGQRGFAVKLLRSDKDLDAYFTRVTGRVVMQAYHPGPCECGIFWLRHAPDAARAERSVGRIFSITRKEFPVITGDGVSTLEELIERHPRYRRQHRVFLERFRDEASRVLAGGEVLRLSVSGNHCQGTLFRDGSDLLTPELSRVVDVLCARFGESTGCPGGLDVARLDVRYESDELLRSGRGFAVVELNGTSAESTNIYDPAWGLRRAYGVLFAQWRAMYALGAVRIAHGGRAVSARELFAMIRAHYTTRTGDEIAD